METDHARGVVPPGRYMTRSLARDLEEISNRPHWRPPDFVPGKFYEHPLVTMRSIATTSGRRIEDDDVVLHPKWVQAWACCYQADYSPNRLGLAAGFASLEARGSGCCGPDGEVHCEHGHPVGWVQGDCWQDPHVLLLSAKQVERSDEVDGFWITYDFSGVFVTRAEGFMKNGLRTDEWSLYRHQPAEVDFGPLVEVRYYENGTMAEQVGAQ